MRAIILLTISFLLFVAGTPAQSKTNDAIAKQIKSLKADKTFTLTYDKGSNMSKLMAIGDNFAEAEAKKAGIQAMNFGMAFFYQGQTLTAAPDPIAITFWVMSKKPQFAAKHKWVILLGKDSVVDHGDGQYAARVSENMEYLNFKISRQDLTNVASGGDLKFTLGTAEFHFTPEHLKLFKNLLDLSDPAK